MTILSANKSKSVDVRAVVLTSGGKDSVLALHLAVESGLSVTSLLTIFPEDNESMLYHTHNLEYVEAIADSLDVEWLTRTATKNEETTALSEALRRVEADAVVTGAISSNYQKRRFEEAARHRGLKTVTPLWGMSANQVFSEMFHRRMKVIVDAVAAYGLDEEWLGKELTCENTEHLLMLSEKCRFNPLGEGGDFDTFVLDAPLYRKRLVITDAESRWMGDHGMLKIRRMVTEMKSLNANSLKHPAT